MKKTKCGFHLENHLILTSMLNILAFAMIYFCILYFVGVDRMVNGETSNEWTFAIKWFIITVFILPIGIYFLFQF